MIYSDKTKHVLEDMGFAGTVYDLRREEPWPDADMTAAPIPESHGSGHFEKLDQILK